MSMTTEPMKIQCPHCGKAYSQILTSEDGNKVYCYGCKKLLREFDVQD